MVKKLCFGVTSVQEDSWCMQVKPGAARGANWLICWVKARKGHFLSWDLAVVCIYGEHMV